MHRNPIRTVPPYRPPAGCPSAAPTVHRAPPDPAPQPDRIAGCGHVVRHLIEIDGRPYSLSLLPRAADSAALRVWQLRRLAGREEVYQVSELPAAEGWSACTCGDWHYRHEGRGSACKHVLALGLLVRAGHLPPPPEPAPPAPALPEGLAWTDVSDAWSLGPTPEDLDVTPMFLAGAASVAAPALPGDPFPGQAPPDAATLERVRRLERRHGQEYA